MYKEPKDIFVEKLIKNELASPIKREFRIKKWVKEWNKVKDEATPRDSKVYEAGLMVDSLLGDIREKFKELYVSVPDTTYEKLMLAYVSLSNRDVSVAFKLATKEPCMTPQAAVIKSNIAGNELSLSEIAHGSVDGMQLAIRECQRHIDKNIKVAPSLNPLDIMDFIQRESSLSQLYSTYVHLWQCIMWSDYDVKELDQKKKYFTVTQPHTPFEASFEASATRKSRLSGQKTLIAMSPSLQNLFKNDCFVVIKRQNKKRVAIVKAIQTAGNKLITFNTLWQVETLDLQNYFPKEWLIGEYEMGFSISETLDVMRCLMLMAKVSEGNFPENDAAQNLNKLMEFCPRVQTFSLRIALNKATNINSDKILKILNFLTATSSQNSDLWCEPLIKTNENEYAILVSALASPSIMRLVEHWFTSFGIPLEDKGYIFENTVNELLNKQLKQNKLIIDYDAAISKRIKLATGEEEFDLLARIDNMIIIGESKSIVTTDSEISKYRTAKILSHAGKQVSRKTEFLKQNIESIFILLGWKYDRGKEYEIAQCIINSSQIFVGHSFNEIPVIDEKLLKYYFESPKIRIMSVPLKSGGNKDIAWYRLYENIQELKDNFPIYLSNLPQLNDCGDSFKYSDINLPYILDESFKITKKRLVLKSKTPMEIMKREHKFIVVKTDDFDKELSQIKAII